MTLSTILLAAGLIIGATIVGMLWRRRQGRSSRTSGGTNPLSALEFGEATAFGSVATLLQFSTQFCSSCPSTRALLTRIADGSVGIVHVDVDLTDRGDLANRFQILQTPTTLVLDTTGTVRARIGGAPRPGVIEAELAALVEGAPLTMNASGSRP